MRMLMKAHMEVQTANIAISDGSLQKAIGATLAALKPEAVYFCTETGRRTVLAVFEASSSSIVPAAAEPMFQSLGAEVHFLPVMSQTELEAGLKAWMQQK